MMENKSGPVPWEMGHSIVFFVLFCFLSAPPPPMEGKIPIDLDLDLRLPQAL